MADPKTVIIEGHRGYCARFPENTLLSYEAAIDLGVDMFEFDIWLTKDKVPVLMHDGNCLRTCGVNRHLRDMTLAEVKTLDAGFAEKFGDEYVGRGIEVPTLEELCELVSRKRPGMVLGVEIKEYTDETVDIAVPILKKYGLFSQACFYAFDQPTLARLKNVYGARVMGYPDFQMKRRDEHLYEIYDEIGLSTTIQHSEIYPIYEKKGFPMHFYCSDTEEEVAFALAHPCVLITANDPIPLFRLTGRPMGKIKDADGYGYKKR